MRVAIKSHLQNTELHLKLLRRSFKRKLCSFFYNVYARGGELDEDQEKGKYFVWKQIKEKSKELTNTSAAKQVPGEESIEARNF